MSYAHPRSSTRRMTGVAMTVALHIVLVYAMIHGLARKIVEVVLPPLETKIIEEVKPPAPDFGPTPKGPPKGAMVGETLDLVGGDLGRSPSRSQDGLGLLQDVLGFLELGERVRRPRSEGGESTDGDLETLGEARRATLNVDRQRGDRWHQPTLGRWPRARRDSGSWVRGVARAAGSPGA